jgi:hypothetical protein
MCDPMNVKTTNRNNYIPPRKGMFPPTHILLTISSTDLRPHPEINSRSFSQLLSSCLKRVPQSLARTSIFLAHSLRRPSKVKVWICFIQKVKRRLRQCVLLM